ncbi:hypothetical protein Hypma_006198 [Hypsizygus marmoreus]|uniref:Uncharacterized protein n=1 Tax=Hypsizygus marmoreus TaxID=39966 RepID=A0A369K5H4_HYPMA|nr:hypothetical protein Hypma_006198 [Hypsizygus marmoreus]
MAFNFNLARLREIEKKLDEYKVNEQAQSEDAENGDKYFSGLLGDVCNLVRDATVAPDFQDLLAQADRVINDAVAWAYDEGDVEFMRSFAHSDSNPEVDATPLSSMGDGVHAYGDIKRFLPIINMLMGREATDEFIPPPGKAMPRPPDPWAQSVKPHPSTTRLSRFKGDVSVSATSDTPTANAVYEARCEVTSMNINLPIHLTISSNNSCLAVPCMGGWKNRSPVLHYYLLDDSTDFPEEYTVEVGLAEIAYHSAIDEPPKLIFVADDERVKSYAWGSQDKVHKKPLPTHTMDSADWKGPLTVLSGGRFIRAGKGSAGVWSLDTLQTHGPRGKDIIGGEFGTEDEDELENVEPSFGSKADSTLAFADPEFSPSIWRTHPSLAGTMLCGQNPQETRQYSCVSLDLEGGGRIVTRYLGHGGEIDAIRTSAGDPNAFVTACSDGYARYFDGRQPLPALTFDIGRRTEECPAVEIAHPDGIPTMFTGAMRHQCVKLWDLRAKSAVYELSTGNNAVASLAWDTTRNTLYAATECHYVDRMGRHNGYRRAKVPADQNPESDGDEDDDGEEYEGRCWPEQAYHDENYFGYLFDAGEHIILRYSFKENPDTSFLPPYGNASMNSRMYW